VRWRLGHRVWAHLRGCYARLSRREQRLAVIGSIGFLWSLIVVTPAAFNAVLKPSAEEQRPYAPPGDTNEGDVKQILRRLDGVPNASGEDERNGCWNGMAIWAGSERLVRGRGPSNGSTVTYWATDTINTDVFFGRYTFDLSYLVEPGTGAIGFSHVVQDTRNTRLIERVPPPPPGPPGWRVIQPGECVFAKEQPPDADGAIGRFLIDLPGKARILIETEPSRIELGPIEERLAFDGREAVREPIPGAEGTGIGFRQFHYRTEQAGRHSLTIQRPPDLPASGRDTKARLRYSLMVVWGENGFIRSCTSPSDDLTCPGVTDND